MGLILSKNGIHPTKHKVETIKQLPAPANAKEVRSFLGMTNYLSRFIHHYSRISTPLRELTKKETIWKWTQICEKAFKDLKDAITTSTVMSYFNLNKETTLITDAGSDALSAILLQHTPIEDDYKVVAYASRALTAVEHDTAL